MSLETGSRLGPYEVVSHLGSGGMGDVYKALDDRLDRAVAIKVLASCLAGNTEALARFEQEAKAVAALAHPNILSIFDVGTGQGVYFAVTEFLQGETLRELLARELPPWRKAVAVAIDVAEGLSAAHSKGIVHRDIKPENIFVTHDQRVKILDFGLAVPHQALLLTDDQSHVATAPLSMKDDPLIGTIPYMAPEQLRGGAADLRSDLFALGCVLHEMLGGKSPFWRPAAVQTIDAILTQEPPDLASFDRDLPRELLRIVNHALEKNPDDRFQTARDFAFALREVLSGARSRSSAAKKTKGVRSIAVLPFRLQTIDPATEYLADGVTESIINTLARLPKLRVVPRSSVFRYKQSTRDPVAIGRDLGVQNILTGSLMQHGNKLTLAVELDDTERESQLWGDRYTITVDEVLEVQEQIAARIVEKLKMRLSGADKKKIQRPTESSAAYQLYLKGRYLWNKRTEDGLRKSVEFFQKAIEEDPAFALAYSGLADAYTISGYYCYLAPRDSFPKARAAALRALELDEKLPEAHTSLAEIAYLHEWDWARGEREFKKALALNPNYGVARHWYALFLATRGRTSEAIEEMRVAAGLDPLAPVIATNVGTVLQIARKFEEAVAELERVLESEPNFGVAHFRLAEALERLGRLDRALESIETAIELTGYNVRMIAVRGHILARIGRREEALAVLEELTTLSRRRYLSPYDIATVHLGLGQLDETFAWLGRAFEDHSHWLAWLTAEPKFDDIARDARFVDLLKRVGF